MNTLKKAPRFSVGIDLSSESFVAAVCIDGTVAATSPSFQQTTEGFTGLIAWMKQHKVTRSIRTAIAMETTGSCSTALLAFLSQKRYQVILIDAARIARQRSRSAPKSDPADARAIADYLFRFWDTVRLWEPRPDVLMRLNNLLSIRELIVQNSTALKNWRIDKTKQRDTAAQALAILTPQLSGMKEAIAELDREIMKTVMEDEELALKVQLLDTIPGVGVLLATNFLLAVDGQPDPHARRMANYVGICPHEYTSGTSVRRKARSSRMGPPRTRKLLNLAARSVMTHQAVYKEYTKSLLLKGKPKMVILNNIANKLIRVMCAVLRDQKQFDPSYQSTLLVRS
jgi:transposase